MPYDSLGRPIIPQRPRIVTLPPELLDRIMGCLAADGAWGVEPLGRCATSSRHLLAAARPHLYRVLDIYTFEGYHPFPYYPNPVTSPVVMLDDHTFDFACRWYLHKSVDTVRICALKEDNRKIKRYAPIETLASLVPDGVKVRIFEIDDSDGVAAPETEAEICRIMKRCKKTVTRYIVKSNMQLEPTEVPFYREVYQGSECLRHLDVTIGDVILEHDVEVPLESLTLRCGSTMDGFNEQPTLLRRLTAGATATLKRLDITASAAHDLQLERFTALKDLTYRDDHSYKGDGPFDASLLSPGWQNLSKVKLRSFSLFPQYSDSFFELIVDALVPHFPPTLERLFMPVCDSLQLVHIIKQHSELKYIHLESEPPVREWRDRTEYVLRVAEQNGTLILVDGAVMQSWSA